MPDTAKTREEADRTAVSVHHARPLISLALGGGVAAVYWLVGDTLYLVAGALVAFYLHLRVTAKHSQRHTVLEHCSRCIKLAGQGPVSRLLRWYFHRRIWDNKAGMLIVAAGLVITVVYTALGKPHAVLPFVVAYEIYMVQFALLFRSLVVHRGNEVSCRQCGTGDEMHPYGRVHGSELEG